jgi:hypothetical protein
MVADRRLTNLATGELIEDEACKMVVQGRQVAWAYTGLANVKPAPRGETGFWLLQTLSAPETDAASNFEHVRAAAVAAFSRITHLGPRAKRHAFVAAGWDEDEEGELRPLLATISNALREDGQWADRAEKEFAIRPLMLRDNARALLVYGQPMSHAGSELLRSSEDVMASSHAKGRDILDALVEIVRANASANTAIGEGLLGIVLPKRTVGPTGGFTVEPEGVTVAGEPMPANDEGPIAVYLPSGSSVAESYAPHYVDGNLSLGGLVVHRRALSGEEIKRLYESGRRKLE